MAIEDNTDLDGLHNDDIIVNEELDENGEPKLKEGDQEEEEEEKEDTEGKKKPEGNPDPELSGMEKFLSEYGIIGGMIPFEEGESKHFEELTDEEKFNVLSTLIESHAVPIEQKYGLDQDEVNILNYFRSQEKPITEALDELVEKRLQDIILERTAASTDYENMPSDAIYLKWLKENNPEASEEDLKEDLETAKKLKSFEKTVDGVKKIFVEKQAAEIAAQEAERKKSELAELEADRETIVKHVSQIDQIAGFTVTDIEKNEILSKLLEVNEHGDSLFMEEVFADPAKLFKAAWLYNKAEKMFDDMADYYKKELSKQYKKGREEALNGTPREPIVINKGESNKNIIAKREEVNAKSQDELFEND